MADTQENITNNEQETQNQEAFNRVSVGEVDLGTQDTTQDTSADVAQGDTNQDTTQEPTLDTTQGAENVDTSDKSQDEALETMPKDENNQDTTKDEGANNQGENVDNGTSGENDNETIEGEIIAIPSMPQYTQAKETINERLAKYLAEVEEAIKNDESIITHTRYTLSGINELLAISKELWEMYRYNLDIVQTDNQEIIKVKDHINLIGQYINKSLKQLDKSYKTTKALFDSTEDLLDEAREQANAIARDTQVALEAFKEVERLENRIVEIKEIIKEFTTMKETAELLKQEINDTAPTILNEVKTELLNDKERYERELDQRKNEVNNAISKHIAYLGEKMDNFETEFAKKQALFNKAIKQLEALKARIETLEVETKESIETNKQNFFTYTAELSEDIKQKASEANTLIAEAKGQLSATAEEKIANLTRISNEKETSVTETSQSAILDIQNQQATATKAIANAITELGQEKDTHIDTLEAAKTTHLATLGEATQNHINELGEVQVAIKEDFTQVAQDMKDNLDSVASAQIADLSDIVTGIKALQISLGHNFKHKTYTSNGTFSPSPNAVYHYVFLQGGIGSTNAETAGGLSTFGSLLTAQGGSGSAQGVGQKGQVVGGFVEVTSEQNIVVAEGGICIVSWSERGQIEPNAQGNS